MASTAREDERIVRPVVSARANRSCAEVDRFDFGESDFDIFLSGKDRANRNGDIGGREPRGRDLVKERLKKVVVSPIDERDFDLGFTRERFRGGKAAEAAPDDEGLMSGKRGVHRFTGGLPSLQGAGQRISPRLGIEAMHQA